MSEVISSVKLICQNGNSNKFYNVNLVLDNGILSLKTEHGAIGAKPKNGVSGSFEIDVPTAIDEGGWSLTQSLLLLATEANTVIKSKHKKGYKVASNSQKLIDSADVMAALDDVYQFKNKPAQAGSEARSENCIEVEVVGMTAGVAKVAKVLSDFSYEVLGEVTNPLRKVIRVGDVVHVREDDNGWILV